MPRLSLQRWLLRRLSIYLWITWCLSCLARPKNGVVIHASSFGVTQLELAEMGEDGWLFLQDFAVKRGYTQYEWYGGKFSFHQVRNLSSETD